MDISTTNMSLAMTLNKQQTKTIGRPGKPRDLHAQSKGSPGLARRGQKGRALELGLSRLRSAIAALPAALRRKGIEHLPQALRQALLQHMEAAAAFPAKSPSRPPGKRSFEQASQEAAAGNCEGMSTCPMRGSWPRSAKPPGGVCTLKQGGILRYFARATLGGVAISSRSTRSMAQAQRLHGILSSLAEAWRAASNSRPSTDFGTWLCAAFGAAADALLEPQMLVNLRAEQWSFRLIVDARRWAGRTLSSRQVSSVHEVVAARKSLDEAKLQGWEAMRKALLPYLPQRCPRAASRGPAMEGAVEAASARLAVLDTCRQQEERRRELRDLTRKVSRERREGARHAVMWSVFERRLARILPRLEKALQARPRDLAAKGSPAASKRKASHDPRSSPRCVMQRKDLGAFPLPWRLSDRQAAAPPRAARGCGA